MLLAWIGVRGHFGAASIGMEKIEMTIEDMKDAIRKEGWQWIEHMYHPDDPLNICQGYQECHIRLSKSKSPHAFDFNDLEYDKSEIGWGRFSPLVCWGSAYQAIVVEKKWRD